MFQCPLVKGKLNPWAPSLFIMEAEILFCIFCHLQFQRDCMKYFDLLSCILVYIGRYSSWPALLTAFLFSLLLPLTTRVTALRPGLWTLPSSVLGHTESVARSVSNTVVILFLLYWRIVSNFLLDAISDINLLSWVNIPLLHDPFSFSNLMSCSLALFLCYFQTIWLFLAGDLLLKAASCLCRCHSLNHWEPTASWGSQFHL